MRVLAIANGGNQWYSCRYTREDGYGTGSSRLYTGGIAGQVLLSAAEQPLFGKMLVVDQPYVVARLIRLFVACCFDSKYSPRFQGSDN
jgi:hypothetical protein